VSAELLVVALSLLVLVVAGLALEVLWRAPRCRACGVTSEALPTALIHTVPVVLEVAHRCPRCGLVVSRRRFGDWE
jgi:hypothetical protein